MQALLARVEESSEHCSCLRCLPPATPLEVAAGLSMLKAIFITPDRPPKLTSHQAVGWPDNPQSADTNTALEGVRALVLRLGNPWSPLQCSLDVRVLLDDVPRICLVVARRVVYALQQHESPCLNISSASKAISHRLCLCTRAPIAAPLSLDAVGACLVPLERK